MQEKQTPLPVCRRMDLIIQQTGFGQSPLWTIKDPVSERFFQLRQVDFFVFMRLDGQTSVEEIQRRFLQSYAPQKISEEQILQFIQRLFTQGLIHIEKFGLGDSISRRQLQLQERERRQKYSSLLAIRFRGIDPDRWLGKCSPWVSWAFSPLAVFLSLCLSMFALGIVVSEWETILRELPRFETFFKSGQFFALVLSISCIKILHELAHAFVCKRFGGECHEVGLMLLVFTPCLYCNVSDSWLLRNRWHRIAIAGAGIYVEILLASLCVVIWNWSVPGTVHTLCLYIMVISSVSTLLLNGNPLLRYDGYYILSDLTGIPNLRSRSQALVKGWLSRFFFGIQISDPLRGQSSSRLFLGIYGLLSGVYSWCILFAILWMLYQFAKPYGMESAILLLGAFLVSVRMSSVAGNLINFMKSLRTRGELRPVRLLLTAGLVCFGLYQLLMLELPRRVSVPCRVEASKTVPVFISTPGKVQLRGLHNGMLVSKGNLLALLTNRELEREVLELNQSALRQKKKLELLLLQQVENATAAAEIPSARAKLFEFEERYQQKKAELQRLTINAPISGRLISGEKNDSSGASAPEFQREGSAFESVNQGAWLEVGTLLCTVADESSYDAVLYVDQSNVVHLSEGESAVVVLSQLSGQIVEGTIVSIASEPVERVPPILFQENMIPFEPDGNGQLRPLRPVHEVRVQLKRAEKDLVMGQIGRATIHLKAESVFQTLLRTLQSTLTFEL